MAAACRFTRSPSRIGVERSRHGTTPAHESKFAEPRPSYSARTTHPHETRKSPNSIGVAGEITRNQGLERERSSRVRQEIGGVRLVTQGLGKPLAIDLLVRL